MDIALIIIGSICMLVALVGCIMPALPGPILAYAGLLIIHFTEKIEFSTHDLVIGAVITLVAIILDYIVPAWCTKTFGGSKWGAFGSIVGLIVGLIAPIPFGFIVGPFVGAVVGEILAGKSNVESLKSGIGSFVGFILSTGLKLAIVIGFCVVFCMQIWETYFVNA